MTVQSFSTGFGIKILLIIKTTNYFISAKLWALLVFCYSFAERKILRIEWWILHLNHQVL